METRIIRTSLVPALAAVLFLFGAGLANSQTRPARGERTEKQERPAQESAEMRALRHKGHDLAVEHIRLAVKMGRLTEAAAAFRIKALESRKSFLDANPTWTQFERGMGFGPGHSRRGKDGECQGKGRQGGGRGGRGARDGERASLEKRPPVERESAEMKDLRHKRHAAAVAAVNLAAKDGKLTAETAAFRIKAMDSRKSFLDANPTWTQFGRGMGFGPGQGQRGRRGGGDCGPHGGKKRGRC